MIPVGQDCSRANCWHCNAYIHCRSTDSLQPGTSLVQDVLRGIEPDTTVNSRVSPLMSRLLRIDHSVSTSITGDSGGDLHEHNMCLNACSSRGIR
mgnify:FL=1